MWLKKTFIVILLIVAICSVSIGCVYLVIHMLDAIILRVQRYPAVAVVITVAACVVASLIKGILEIIQK